MTRVTPHSGWGALCVIAALEGVDKRRLRPMIRKAWQMDHRGVVESCRFQKIPLKAFLRWAEFEFPDWPDPVRLYRGTRRISFDTALTGDSWTTEPGGACAYAMGKHLATRHGDDRRPLVVTREVPLASIVLYVAPNTEVEDCDEILFDAPPCGEVFADPVTWRRMADEWHAALVERNRLAGNDVIPAVVHRAQVRNDWLTEQAMRDANAAALAAELALAYALPGG